MEKSMTLKVVLAMGLSLVLWGCSSGGGSTDGGDDGIVWDGEDGGDGLASDANDDTVGDGLDGGEEGEDQGGADEGGHSHECIQGVIRCGTGLECLCCGTIGATPICLCTTACKKAGDCTRADLPECNLPPAGGEGICTPTGYNCCWDCK